MFQKKQITLPTVADEVYTAKNFLMALYKKGEITVLCFYKSSGFQLESQTTLSEIKTLNVYLSSKMALY